MARSGSLWVRVAAGTAGAAVGYVVLLGVVGVAARGCITGQIEARLERALDADVTIGDSSISLLRGSVQLRAVTVERDHGGALSLTLAEVQVETAPLGWFAVDRELDYVRVRDADMQVSARGLYELHQRRKRLQPLPIRRLEINDAHIAVMATSYLPRFGRFELNVDRARTREVSLRSGLSWLYRIEELEASIELQELATVGLGYGEGMLTLRGGIFGSRPLEVAFPLPDHGTGGYELADVVTFGAALAKALGRKAIEHGVEAQLRDWLDL